MTDGEALVYAALASPEDRTPRLVLADWLDESGLTDQAELVRTRCSLATLSADHPDRHALLRRERELRDRHVGDWVEQCGLALTWDQALSVVCRRLAETVAGCGRGDVPLRTPALFPRSILWRGGRAPPFQNRTTAERQVLVNRLANQRARLLLDRGAAPGASDRLNGRLLVFYPNATLSDGAAATTSGRFFDDENIPAWDCWVWAGEDRHAAEASSYGSYLVCWVSPEWVDRADAGIQVNPEQCLRWATG